jgi:peptide/nickel transport system substrate-binding protein
VIDAPGPWGTGPFTLSEGYSSINTRIAIMKTDPFTSAGLIESEDRAPRLVLQANQSHWNHERGPRLQQVVFRNDLTPAQALELCISTEGEMDIVTEVSPADAARVLNSPYAKLVECDANRVLVGILNRSHADVPLSDKRVRQALNLAVDCQKVIEQGLGGYANPVCALTPSWCGGFPADAKPYPHDPGRAKQLLGEVGWPSGRNLRLAAPAPFAGIAQLVAGDITAALGIDVDIMLVPLEKMLAGARALAEKKLSLPWDMLITGWFDLSSEAPPAAVHREFFGSDGAFRAGPELPAFDELYTEMTRQLDGSKLVQAAEQIDRYVFEEALALFLCAPKALYAVNKHVSFGPYRTTFELAEAEVDDEHWSRTKKEGQAFQAAPSPPSEPLRFVSGSSGNAC